MDDVEVCWTEWGVIPTHFARSTTACFSATFLLHGMKYAQGRADALAYWVVSDHFEELGRPPALLHGGFGLLTVGNLRKPRWWALALAQQLGDELLPLALDGRRRRLAGRRLGRARPGRRDRRPALERHARPAKAGGDPLLDRTVTISGLPAGHADARARGRAALEPRGALARRPPVADRDRARRAARGRPPVHRGPRRRRRRRDDRAADAGHRPAEDHLRTSARNGRSSPWPMPARSRGPPPCTRGRHLVRRLEHVMPVLIRPSVGPAMISVPSSSRRFRQLDVSPQTACSSSVIVAAKFSRGAWMKYDPFAHAASLSRGSRTRSAGTNASASSAASTAQIAR